MSEYPDAFSKATICRLTQWGCGTVGETKAKINKDLLNQFSVQADVGCGMTVRCCYPVHIRLAPVLLAAVILRDKIHIWGKTSKDCHPKTDQNTEFNL